MSRRTSVIAAGLLLAGVVAFDLIFVFAFPPARSSKQGEEPPSGPIADGKTVPGRTQDCGAKSLYIICKARGITTSVEELRRLTRTTDEGTSMLDLKHASGALGFRAEPYELSFESLRRHLAIPGNYAILHANSKHFFPAVRSSGSKVRVLDPAIGIEEVDERMLRSSRYRWEGKALLLTPVEEQAASH
jgi:ABC-type bacteriocin/lantibiotic exporter with double-glycine peptidase domain